MNWATSNHQSSAHYRNENGRFSFPGCTRVPAHLFCASGASALQLSDPPFVTMVQSTNLRQRDYFAQRRRLKGPMNRRIFRQRQVSTRPLVRKISSWITFFLSPSFPFARGISITFITHATPAITLKERNGQTNAWWRKGLALSTYVWTILRITSENSRTGAGKD